MYQRENRDDQTGELMNFAVGFSVRPALSEEDWVQVVRVDVAHGFVHVDHYRRDGERSKCTECVPERCKNDLDAALKWAIDFVWEIEERMSEWG